VTFLHKRIDQLLSPKEETFITDLENQKELRGVFQATIHLSHAREFCAFMKDCLKGKGLDHLPPMEKKRGGGKAAWWGANSCRGDFTFHLRGYQGAPEEKDRAHNGGERGGNLLVAKTKNIRENGGVNPFFLKKVKGNKYLYTRLQKISRKGKRCCKNKSGFGEENRKVELTQKSIKEVRKGIRRNRSLRDGVLVLADGQTECFRLPSQGYRAPTSETFLTGKNRSFIYHGGGQYIYS